MCSIFEMFFQSFKCLSVKLVLVLFDFERFFIKLVYSTLVDRIQPVEIRCD